MDYEEFEVRVLRLTEKAALLEFVDLEIEEWIPFSQIEDEGWELEPGACENVAITRWIAEQKGLI